ncbi:uncharacterized protein F4822DRAFT_427848 [Hypoxylon trugodes]|uniref:uncharacterized protein n=1 Tax=Hypoxylon trugodes TaxID=326681 RepID=UPI00218F1632|nr:uncharacterized protein F4822DRAFT_427848 [Hypoxylon trugodes]KAI1389500.1 hypothetical protein F4822DRAFT_427848 [Hypoxylon trugodes]
MATGATPPLSSYEDDRGPNFRAYIEALTVIALIATALRFWSRSLHTPHGRQNYRFWWDDWFALAGATTLIGQFAVTILSVENGLGRHLWALSEQQLDSVLKLLWVVYWVYDATLLLTKASALLFLTRIFHHHKKTEWFNVLVLITHGLNVAWFLGIIIATILFCNPIERNWKPTVPGTCGIQNNLYLGSAIPSVSIDFIILILPLPKVWHLHTSPARKWGISLVFALGYGVIVASLGRLITVLKESAALNTDITYKGIDIFYWTWAESPVTILGISLPAMLRLSYYLSQTYMQPLLTKFSYLLSRSTLRSRSGNFSYLSNTQDPIQGVHLISNNASGSIHISDNKFDALPSSGIRGDVLHLSDNQQNYTAHIDCGRLDRPESSTLPNDSIRVESDVQVSRQGL